MRDTTASVEMVTTTSHMDERLGQIAALQRRQPSPGTGELLASGGDRFRLK
jgi:hypothetical protein